MPYTIDPAGRVDDLTRATVQLISADGIGAFTLRKLAAAAGMSPSGLLAHLEHKRRITGLIAGRLADWLDHAITERVACHGTAGVLPDEEMLAMVRAWLALTEIGRSDEVLAWQLAYQKEGLDHAIRAAFALDDRDIVTGQTLCALVGGLWAEMCAGQAAMPYEHALTILRHLCARIGVPFRGRRW